MYKDTIPKALIVVLFSILSVSIGLNNIVIGYKISGISIDRFIQLVLFFLFFKMFIRDMKNECLRVVFVFTVTLLAIQLFNYLSISIQGEVLSSSDILRRLIRTASYFIFIYLVYALISKSLSYINVILAVFLFAFIFAFFQSSLTPFTDVFQSLRLSYFSSNMKPEDLEIFGSFVEDHGRDLMRVTGPYGQTITLSYALVSASIIAAYCYVKTNSKLYLAFIFFSFLVSVLSVTRSSTLAIIILMIYLFWNSRTFIYVMIFALSAIVYLMMLDSYYLDYLNRLISSDSSSSSKILLLATGILTILKNPFGITSKAYGQVKQEMFNTYGNYDILKYPSHNGLVNLAFEYSSLVYIPLLFLIYYLVVKTKNLGARKARFWAVAYFSYFVQQSFHNNGFYYTDFAILIVFALHLYDISRINIDLRDVNIR